MPYSQPIFEKNWIFRVNQSISKDAIHASIIYQMKESLKFGSWTVVKSSNGTSVSSSDLWSSETVIVPPGGATSWIVLRNTAIDTSNAKFDICLSLSSSSIFSFYVSPLGYDSLTGSTSARPSTLNANDEISFTNPTTDFIEDSKIHCMQSTDGECTRILITQFDVVKMMLILDKIKTPLTSQQFNIPYIISFNGGGLSFSTSYSAVAGNTNYGLNIAIPSGFATYSRVLSGNQKYSSLSIGTEDAGLYYNTFLNKLVISSLEVHGAYAGWNGKIGNIYDLWIAPNYLPSGMTMPSDNSKKFAVIFGKTSNVLNKSLIIPWNGTTPSFQF